MKKHLTKSQVGYICTDLDHYCSKSWITNLIHNPVDLDSFETLSSYTFKVTIQPTSEISMHIKISASRTFIICAYQFSNRNTKTVSIVTQSKPQWACVTKSSENRIGTLLHCKTKCLFYDLHNINISQSKNIQA